jgi:hypothetical protein
MNAREKSLPALAPGNAATMSDVRLARRLPESFLSSLISISDQGASSPYGTGKGVGVSDITKLNNSLLFLQAGIRSGYRR